MSSRTPKRSAGTSRVLVGLLAGAAVGVVLASLTGLAPNTNRPPARPDQPSAEAFAAPPGSCLDWTDVSAGDAHRVDCAQRHLFEVTGPVDLAAGFGPAAGFPDDATWRSLLDSRCGGLTTRYLANRFDPYGLYSIGALKPSSRGWLNGERELRCGLQVTGPSGALYPVAGSASDHDQSAIHPIGTCLGIDGKAVGDPVDCATPHSYEVVGVVDLSQQFPSGYPEIAKQDEYLGPTCAAIAATYAGGADVISGKGLAGAWDDRKAESWAAGSRRVNCLLGAKLPDALGAGLAPVTGSVRGAVSVGSAVAPSMRPPAPPGAPVPGATPVTPPPSGQAASETSPPTTTGP